jgi:hypothetical protein
VRAAALAARGRQGARLVNIALFGSSLVSGFAVERHPEREVYLCRRTSRRANELTEVTP